MTLPSQPKIRFVDIEGNPGFASLTQATLATLAGGAGEIHRYWLVDGLAECPFGVFRPTNADGYCSR